MKKILTISFTLAASMSAMASRVALSDTIPRDAPKEQMLEYRHELSMGMNNLSDRVFPYLFWDYYYTASDFTDYYFLFNDNMAMPSYGISYKYHFDQCALRAGLDFNSDNNTFKPTSPASSSYNSTHLNLTRFGTRIGWEKIKNAGKSQLFAGGDLFYESFSSKYTVTDRNGFEDYSFKRSSIGFSPLMGVRYSLSKIISFSAETKLNIAYNSQAIKDVNSGSSAYSSYKGSGVSVKISPISQLAINIHF